MALNVVFTKANGTTETHSNCESVTINKDGSCTIMAERSAPSGVGTGSQILRFPETPYAVTVNKT